MKDIRKTSEYVDELEVALARAKAEITAFRKAGRYVIDAWGTDEWIRFDMQDAVDELQKLCPQPPEPAQDDEVKP